jgi:hypothetical protein
MKIMRTDHIHCGGRVPIGAIASRYPVKEEKVSTPIRRSERIRGMKSKDYKEVSPEPKDYGGSDYSDDRSMSSWAAAGREDNDLYYWEEVPLRRLPRALMAPATTMVPATVTTAETLAMTTLSGCI